MRFGALTALSDVSFTVEPGTIHAIIGPNGAGKSTMFNVLSGVYKAAEGQVRFGEHRLTGCGRTRSPARGRPRVPEHRAVRRARPSPRTSCSAGTT